MDILEEKEKGTENVFKEILENLPNMGRKMDMQIYKSRRITNRLNSKCAILKYILVKLSKFKHKENLKAARDKWLIEWKCVPLHYELISDSAETRRPEENGMIYSKYKLNMQK